MKKISVCLLIFILSLLTSCAGVSDWSYELPNGYEMWRVNSNEVIIKYTEEEANDTVISSFIKEFSYDDRYVLTRNVSSITDNDIFNEKYYILDTEEQILHGPFENLEKLEEEMEKLEISPKKWYRTSPDPNMAQNSDIKDERE